VFFYCKIPQTPHSSILPGYKRTIMAKSTTMWGIHAGKTGGADQLRARVRADASKKIRPLVQEIISTIRDPRTLATLRDTPLPKLLSRGLINTGHVPSQSAA
jgi:hypothetical protein